MLSCCAHTTHVVLHGAGPDQILIAMAFARQIGHESVDRMAVQASHSRVCKAAVFNLAGCEAQRASGRPQTRASQSRAWRPATRCRESLSKRRTVRAKAEPKDLGPMFEEAQNNIMRLNQSRLNALADLKAARQRIADLESRLADAAAEARAQAGREEPSQGEAFRAQSIGVEDNPFQAQSMHRSEGAEAGPSNAAMDLQLPTEASWEQAGPAGVTIAYGTGWDTAYIHFRTPSRGWTEAPGVRMEPGAGELAGSQVTVIPGEEHVEFVMNNGRDDWDTPDPYGGGRRNYVADGPGTYYLKSGRLQKLR